MVQGGRRGGAVRQGRRHCQPGAGPASRCRHAALAALSVCIIARLSSLCPFLSGCHLSQLTPSSRRGRGESARVLFTAR